MDQYAKFTEVLECRIVSHAEYMKHANDRYSMITLISKVSDDGKLYYLAIDKEAPYGENLVAVECLD